ncbi:Rz1-like lysis system protein LysC [Pseudomonas coleopterorum]|uniref:Rz1-like lysis system protein LysC n=1 Tax=Pseudomonas coleopterorum TaxID=1605838 RepID=A0AAJ6M2B3_9PSED|nr:Rz1-like lysis system protein LysC [Pseudomonas coleopterorum]WNC11648.1 Rz1-like lysis system protein LysC [Pseudomonas coleopterorum]
MKTPHFAIGLNSLCLTLLLGCASAPPSPAPTLIVSGCPAVTPCTLPATAPRHNGQLLGDQDSLEAAWADCAAQVDMIFRHQQAATP